MDTSPSPDGWRPRCPPTRPVWPVRLDPAGETGPTRGQARGPGWRRTGPGLYVPAHVANTVEQRIVEAAAHLPPGGMVTGWAALRLGGGGFFDGAAADGRALRVPLLVPASWHRAARPGIRWVRDTLPPTAVRRTGVPCVPDERAVLDAMRLAESDREAVVVMDMAAAAGITSIARVRARAMGEPRRPGLGRVMRGLDLSHEASRSPAESRMRLVWVLDAGLPPPRVNCPVHDRRGRLIGIADLFDPEAGVAGEYDGALHRTRGRHRRDVSRNERFRQALIETFTVVAGDAVDEVVERMRSARRRARWLPAERRPWTMERPEDPDDEPALTLDDRLDLRDRLGAVYAAYDA